MIDVTVWATAEAGAARGTAGLVCDARSGQESPSGVFCRAVSMGILDLGY